MDNNERMLRLMTVQIMRSSVKNGEPDGPIDAVLARTLAVNCTSFWLKDAIRANLQRDPVDGLHDAATLVEIMKDVIEWNLARRLHRSEKEVTV
jgi:hypothetical protein